MVVESLITGACSIATAMIASRAHRRGSWESIASELTLADELARHAKGSDEAALAEEVRKDTYARARSMLHPDRRWAHILLSPSGLAFAMAAVIDTTSAIDWAGQTSASVTDTVTRLTLSIGFSAIVILAASLLDYAVGSASRRRRRATKV